MSIASLKESQQKTQEVLPKPRLWRELPEYSVCHTIADIVSVLESKGETVENAPPVSVIRCAIEEFRKDKQAEEESPTTVELFSLLEKNFPLLGTMEGEQYEVRFDPVTPLEILIVHLTA